MLRPTYWHEKSWKHFIDVTLADLLAKKLSLNAYKVTRNGSTASITIGIQGSEGRTISVTYDGIPVCDAAGIFIVGAEEMVVMPLVPTEHLESVRCSGEIAADFFADRIAPAPQGFFSDPDSVKTWLPISEWFDDFFNRYAGLIDGTNMISRDTHLNRIKIENMENLCSERQKGLTCPVEVPTGPNIGKVLTVSQGAEIQDGKITSVSDDPALSLGASALMIPFYEQSDPGRLTMGANMLRQWQEPEDPEPAIVRTGFEPEEDGFWCGFNLVTVFASVGILNCEDGLVISESGARKFRYSDPLEIGDKLSSRQGYKGVISAIWPDTKMPKLPDGAPADIVQGFSGLHTRMNTGQLFEAIAGRIARATGEPFIASPFAAPSRKELENRLKELGMPGNGMDYLDFGNGEKSTFPSLHGTVYWGRCRHDVRTKIRVFTSPEEGMGQRQGAMEYYACKNAGAFELIRERVTVAASDTPDPRPIADFIAEGGEFPKDMPSSPLSRLQEILSLAGISLERSDDSLVFSVDTSGSYQLACPIPHPWKRSLLLKSLAPGEGRDGWAAVNRENQRLQELISSDAPESLRTASVKRLQNHFEWYLNGLLEKVDLLACGRVLFSGRSVIVPSENLGVDAIGVPDEMAWSLFGPFAAAELGEKDVDKRTAKAAEKLDKIMAASYVVMNRAPTMTDTAILAFIPVRVPHRSIELNPLVCKWCNGDFDGDQVALFLPLQKRVQQDAFEKLSVVGHLRRDPSLVGTLIPPHEAVWGVSHLWLRESGKRKIRSLLGDLFETDEAHLKQGELSAVMRRILDREGPEKTVAVLEELMSIGFREAAASGASMNPFMTVPGTDDAEALSHDEVLEIFESCLSFDSPDYGTQLLLVKSNIRGSSENLATLTHSADPVRNIPLLDGYGVDLHADRAQQMRIHLARFVSSLPGLDEYYETRKSRAYTVLARAYRSKNPGVVFASAALAQEHDPLTDRDTRMFAGLLP